MLFKSEKHGFFFIKTISLKWQIYKIYIFIDIITKYSEFRNNESRIAEGTIGEVKVKKVGSYFVTAIRRRFRTC